MKLKEMTNKKTKQKKTQIWERLAPFFTFLFIGFFLLLLDGFNILTFNWKEQSALVLKTKILEYPINTRKQGTVSAYSNSLLVEYAVNGFNHKKEITTRSKPPIPEIITIRIDPTNIERVTTRDMNIIYYLIWIGLFVILFIISIIHFFTYKPNSENTNSKKQSKKYK